MSVNYREIPGFPGYRAGDDGSIWSQHQMGPRIGFSGEWRQMKTQDGRGQGGHLKIVLRRDGKSYQRWVHRLILESFVGQCPVGMVCRHFPDRDATNNALSNLQWGSLSANMLDRNAHGTGNRGEAHPLSKLTEIDVSEARRLRAKGAKLASLAAQFGVTREAIGAAVRGARWGHVTTQAQVGISDVRGSRHGSALMTDGGVLELRALYAMGARPRDLADRYGISRSCVYGIARRDTWKHLPAESEAAA